VKDVLQWAWQQSGWPAFFWDHNAIAAPLALARRAQGELVGLARLLDLDSQLRTDADVLLQEALSTSRIEGEHPDPQSVESSVAYHLKHPAAGLPPSDHGVDGLVQLLLDATLKYEEPLTRQRLDAWHSALFPVTGHRLAPMLVGTIRTEQMQIVSGGHEREKVHYEALPSEEVPAALDHLLTWFCAPPTGLDGLVRAAIAHLWFEQIHPYADGNGRIGRALMDMALAQDEKRRLRLCSLSVQFEKNRNAYYHQLEQAGRQGLDITAWLLWYLEQVELAARHAIAAFANVLRKARFWLRFADAPLNERQRKALTRLLDAGSGHLEGGMTVRKYTRLARTSRATASRELIQMEGLGCLVRLGKGRSTFYEISWEVA
jgi:Fic family protein